MSSQTPFLFTRENCSIVSEFALENSVLKETLNDRKFWNKLTIKNGASMDRDFAVLSVMRAAYPHDLFPCKFKRDGDDLFFLFQDGFSAIMRLCRKSLVVADIETNENIELSITARFKRFDECPMYPLAVLEDVARKRVFDGKNVDLRNLINDEGLQDLFCCFKSDQFCKYLFNIIIKLAPKPHMMLLSYNQIENLDVLDIMSKQYLAVLDLRHNDITRDGFEKINSNFSIGHLLLDGNPITQSWGSVAEYASYVRKKLPRIKQLDFLNVQGEDSLVFPKVATYLRSPPCKEFVDHFLHHYFGMFAKNRQHLATMYQEGATLTLSLSKLGGPLPKNKINLLASTVAELDHNILGIRGEHSKIYDHVFVGKRRIAEALGRIPELEFAWQSFSVDVPIYLRDQMILISLNGQCQAELPKATPNKLCHLARVVVLTRSSQNPGEWNIFNDMWNITLGPTNDPKMKMSKHPRSTNADFTVILDPQLKDKTILTRIVKKLTKLKPSWVQKFLEESDWDLEFTLQAFTDHLKADAIPIDAFEIPEPKLKELADKIAALRKKQAELGVTM